MRVVTRRLPIALAMVLLPLPGAYAQQADWETHGGDPGGMKYSWLDEINRENVGQLEVVWSWETGEKPLPAASTPMRGQPVAPGKFQGTPVVLDGVMYLSTSYARVVALDAATGEELWAYDPRAYEWGNLPRGCRFCHRGVAVWTDGEERRIFINSRWMLVALDALTGEPIASFGKGGVADLTENLVWETNRLMYTNTSPPVVYQDLVIVGSGVPDNRIYRKNPPGDVQAFNVRTGEFVWSFHTIPQEGEYGNDTWEDDSWSYTGSANVWAPFTVDAERGLVYLPVSTPNNDFYGGHRKGDNLFAESIVCLDANTGRRVWHFQTVRHGIWDYDLPAPPNLITIEVDGETIDAVAVVGKTGFVYVFDRVTGEPVWPIEDRPVPGSDVPGERAALTQPYPTKPPPFGRQGFSEDDLMDFTPELKAMALEVVKEYRLGTLFTPPSLEGTLMMPGIWGAGNWGGAAFDPGSGTLYVKATNWPSLFRVGEARPEPGGGRLQRLGLRRPAGDRRRRARAQASLRHPHRPRSERRRTALANPPRRFTRHPQPSATRGPGPPAARGGSAATRPIRGARHRRRAPLHQRGGRSSLHLRQDGRHPAPGDRAGRRRLRQSRHLSRGRTPAGVHRHLAVGRIGREDPHVQPASIGRSGERFEPLASHAGSRAGRSCPGPRRSNS